MKLLLIGPQGSGKGTIGKMLGEYFHIPLISSGHLLRDLPENHPKKKEVDEVMEKGELVPLLLKDFHQGEHALNVGLFLTLYLFLQK